jgi:hypothetical protein
MTAEQKALKAYKKREKALQRRISAEKDVNKRLLLLLRRANVVINDSWLKEDIEHELKMLKYKYY